MRSGPGTVYGVVKSYAKGTEMEVVGKNPKGDWLKVKAPDGKIGWMATKLLTLNKSIDSIALVNTPIPPKNHPTTTYKTKTNPIDNALYVYVPGTQSTGAFWISQTEITNAQYRKCIEAGKCQDLHYNYISNVIAYRHDSQFADYPVNFVTWDDANAYASWVGGRLPTAEEWKVAALGTDNRKYPWGNQWDVETTKRLNFCDVNCPRPEIRNNNADDGYAGKAPVGTYPKGASPFGALDMYGNLWEWTSTPNSNGGFLCLGGAFNENFRTEEFTFGTGDYDAVGFRVVLPANP